MKSVKLALGLMASVALPSLAFATELEVTHWWTSGGEAAAVAEFAKAFGRHRQHLGRRGDCRVRRHRPPDHDQPHHRRRPDGRDHSSTTAARRKSWWRRA